MANLVTNSYETSVTNLNVDNISFGPTDFFQSLTGTSLKSFPYDKLQYTINLPLSVNAYGLKTIENQKKEMTK